MTEEDGVKAIIALQKLAGIDEPEEKARANWRTLTQEERDRTEYAYNTFVLNKPDPNLHKEN